jgi:hypothetical protein
MTAVTAKVLVSQKSESEYGTNLSFYADYADGRNKAWAVATPNLSMTMTVLPAVGDLFEQGAHYTLTFTPTED